MMVAYAVRRYVITVDLHDINLMLGGEMIPKMVSDDGNSFFTAPSR